MPAPRPPVRELVAGLQVDVGTPIEIGSTPAGERRVVPITGGRVPGPLLTGRVLPGGADHQLIRSPAETGIDARYAVETDDADRVHVENRGLRTGSAAGIARWTADLPVDPDRICFRTTPRFETQPRRDGQP